MLKIVMATEMVCERPILCWYDTVYTARKYKLMIIHTSLKRLALVIIRFRAMRLLLLDPNNKRMARIGDKI